MTIFETPNEVTSADGAGPLQFAFLALRRATAEFLRCNRMRYAPLLVAVALLSGCANRSTGPSFSEIPDSKAVDPYEAMRARQIVPGDRFPVTIGLGPNPPVVVEVTVDKEGYIELPQIGRLRVAGMRASEMEKAAIAEYRKRGIVLQ